MEPIVDSTSRPRNALQQRDDESVYIYIGRESLKRKINSVRMRT